MRIGMNALFFRFPSTGSGQYMTHLLNALAEVDGENEYILLGPDPLPRSYALNERFHFEYVPIPNLVRRSPVLEKLLWEQFTAPAGASRVKADLFHVPFFAPPYFSRTPHIATIHDIIPVRLPVYRDSPRMRAYMRLVTRAARKSSLIITVSQHAKKDIIDVLKVPAERIRVTYEAAGDEYKPITDPEMLARARARYDLSADSRYILYLGGLDHRKNVPLLVRAFAHVFQQVNDPKLHLLVAGNPDQKSGPLFPDPRPVAADLGMSGQIIYRYIEEEDKPAIYSDASVFVYPSYYEGFGLPPLEAMSCGAPVVCSNRTSLPEVVGDAALIFDPDNTGQLVAAIRSVLTDPELAADLRARSLQQAARFNWRKTATETLAIYEEAYKRSRKR